MKSGRLKIDRMKLTCQVGGLAWVGLGWVAKIRDLFYPKFSSGILKPLDSKTSYGVKMEKKPPGICSRKERGMYL
jgi:hypothetical protein